MEKSLERPDPAESDRALVAAMVARDADAVARLYDRHVSRLLGVAYRILGETGEAEEVVQEVFLYAWRAASSSSGTPSAARERSSSCRSLCILLPG